MTERNETVRIGMVLFPNLTLLDLAGPYEVLNAAPSTQVDLLWHRLEPVTAVGGFALTPTATFTEYGIPDVLFVPGGPGQLAAMEDDALIDFVTKAGAPGTGADYITSVCTGALVLGAAGLLKGKRAATHWMSMDQLPLLGAKAVDERVVEDGNVITGGGVTAGIDFGFTVIARLFSEDTAKRIQLLLEYNPQPPFDSGSPKTADPELIKQIDSGMKELRGKRRAVAERIGKERLGL